MRRIAVALVLLVSLMTYAPPRRDVRATSEMERVEQIIASMDTRERVGQLFMVDFVGAFTSDADTIAELIGDYAVGSVILSAPNNNILNDAPNMPAQVAEMTNRLQQYTYSRHRHEDENGDPYFLPLFIALDHEGDGYPRTHFLSGATPIPSAMAIGATWSEQDAEAVGEIVGRELEAVGVNMLLGPVLDVLTKPSPKGPGDMNIRVIGGNPHWVGQLGRAYIRGVHKGGKGRVVTVAKHFPGHGASDRYPDDHVPTVNKSLENLMVSDLVPFFNVTTLNPSDITGTTDAMMPSHIRYRGFQGDTTQLTRPISLDADGMQAFLQRSPLAEWRSNGGLIVCDSLGVGGVKEFYDATLQQFPHRQVARDALMAGNDILPVRSFSVDPNWFTGTLPAVKDTIDHFVEEYDIDTQFRARVDDALQHIILAKLRLYPNLSLAETQVLSSVVDESVGISAETINRVALDGLTLLYPSPEKVQMNPPAPPRLDENVLVMGCFEACLGGKRFSSVTMTRTLLSLYGPEGTGQLSPDRVGVVDFGPLYRLMNGEPESPETVLSMTQTIADADWIILALTDYREDTVPATTAGQQFLQNRGFDFSGKRVVVVAYGAPYYLDAGDLTRVTAYYAVYSKIEPYVRVSLQAVFGEVSPGGGASPVDVGASGYTLAESLQPDATQSIKLSATKVTLAPGEAFEVRTSPIVDKNGHVVWDGTEVDLHGTFLGTNHVVLPDAVTSTVAGVALARFVPDESGTLRIMGRCETAPCGSVDVEVLAPPAPPVVTTVPPPDTPPPVTATSAEPATVRSSPTPENGSGPVPPPSADYWWVLVILAIVGVVAFVAIVAMRSGPTTVNVQQKQEQTQVEGDVETLVSGNVRNLATRNAELVDASDSEGARITTKGASESTQGGKEPTNA